MAALTETLTLELRAEEGKKSFAFSVTQLPPIRAYKLAARLARLFGPAIGPLLGSSKGGLTALAGSLKGGLGKLDLDPSKIGETVRALFLSLDDTEIDGLVRELLSTCTCNNGMAFLPMGVPEFNTLFAGDLSASLKLLAFAAKVNFADFFPVSAGRPG